MKKLLLASLLIGCGPGTVVFPMNAENNSGQTGTVTLASMGSKTRVTVKIKRTEQPDGQPVHLHPGRCGEIGAALKTDFNGQMRNVAFPAMQDPSRFSGEAADPKSLMTRADIEASIEELMKGDLAVNVHDLRDFALYTSCGNLN